MAMQLHIGVTKNIIERCKNCGYENDGRETGTNCAIASALLHIFPNVFVTNFYIFPFGAENEKNQNLKIPLPIVAQQFIKLFDGFRLTPRLRLLLPEFQFTINITDDIIEQINIDEVREMVNNVLV